MSPRFARLSSAALSLLLAHGVVAQSGPGPLPELPRLNAPASQRPPQGAPAPAATVNGTDDEPVVLKLPDADIDTVLSTLEIYTGKVILRPSQLPTMPSGYNPKISKPIPKSQAIVYLETILAMNQIAVVPMGKDALKVVQLGQARMEAPELILGSALDLPPSSKVASKLYQLDFLRAPEFTQLLAPMVNTLFGGPIALANANAVLITDTVSNLQRFEMVQQQVDKPMTTGLSTKFYQLRNGAKASDTVNKLRSILTGTIQTQLGTGTMYSADDRTNQIILITDPRQFPFFDELIDKLDVKADPNTRNEVIYLRHAKAADVVPVLIRIIQNQNQVVQKSQSARPVPGQPPGVPNQPQPNTPPQPTVISGSGSANPALDQGGANEFSALVTVVNDDRSNSVVVSGTVDDIRLLQELIDKLDIVLAQVRIEVVIAEVTLDDTHASGISQLGLQMSGDKLVGFSLSGGNGAWPISVSGSGKEEFASITRPGGDIAVSGRYDLAGVISIGTTPRKSNTTILTVPAIVASHGKKALIQNGETRPVITGSTTYAGGSTGATSSQVVQQPIGTTLTVTPFIGNDGSVQLDLEQELSDVIGEVEIDGNKQPRIGTRKTTSYITARTGEIIVLGGFRKDVDSKSTSRLGPIPIIGDLLGARSKVKGHTELIFFLRPTVLTNNPLIDNAETMNRVQKLPTREEIKQHLDPNYQPQKKPILDRILPK